MGVILLALVVFGARKWWFARSHVSTDNAQVDGHLVPILPKVGGYVAEVRVDENHSVRAGDTLVVLDDRDTKVRNDRKDVLDAGTWIYNDLAKGIDEAKKSGKPLLVTVRCIPCVACAGFDARVLHYDPQIADLMDKFIRVRIVQANSLDLSLFAHDYDISFAAYFLNPDKTIYGRFGTRSDQKNAEKDISMEGLRKAMLAALELHAAYPANKSALAGKRGATPRYQPSPPTAAIRIDSS